MSEPSEIIEFVPRKELDRAEREIERLRKENKRIKQESERLQKESERLKPETERLRRELEAALRASTRQAAPHSRGNPKSTQAARAQVGPELRQASMPSHSVACR